MKPKILLAATALVAGGLTGWFTKPVPPLSAVVEISEAHVAPGDYEALYDPDSNKVAMFKEFVDPHDSTRVKMIAVWYADRMDLAAKPNRVLTTSFGPNDPVDDWYSYNPVNFPTDTDTLWWELFEEDFTNKIARGTLLRTGYSICILNITPPTEPTCIPMAPTQLRVRYSSGGNFLIDDYNGVVDFGDTPGYVAVGDGPTVCESTRLIEQPILYWSRTNVTAAQNHEGMPYPKWLFVALVPFPDPPDSTMITVLGGRELQP